MIKSIFDNYECQAVIRIASLLKSSISKVKCHSVSYEIERNPCQDRFFMLCSWVSFGEGGNIRKP